MTSLLHHSSFRFSLALWIASALALFAAFYLQLDTPQWAAVTVWIIYMQTPRMSYSKIIYWSLGTISGAAYAVFLMACFDESRVCCLGMLTLWLAACAGVSRLLKSFKAYGAALAGYTAAIVSMSAVAQPDQVFAIAETRVACIFLGMGCAIFALAFIVPKHSHWKETEHQLENLFQHLLAYAGNALTHQRSERLQETWAYLSDHLSKVEHTLDYTTAESAESRARAPQAGCLVATLLTLLSRVQAIEAHEPRAYFPYSERMYALLDRTTALLRGISTTAMKNDSGEACARIETLQKEVANGEAGIAAANRHLADDDPSTKPANRQVSDDFANHEVVQISARFLLDRIEELLDELANAVRDFSALFKDWEPCREYCLRFHRDYPAALVCALRMGLAMALASAFWILTAWPSGNQVILFLAIVGELLGLQDDPRWLGASYVKSVALCACVAFADDFWLLQQGEGFLLLALALGLFLLPAGYFYRSQKLIGSSVISMLLFYALLAPTNEMSFDVITFFNNGLSLLAAAAFGFFAFYAVGWPCVEKRARDLLAFIARDLGCAGRRFRVLHEQAWLSRTADRIRLLQQYERKENALSGSSREAILALQIGVRQMALARLAESDGALAQLLRPVIRTSGYIVERREVFQSALRRVCEKLRFAVSEKNRLAPPLTTKSALLSALAEIHEIAGLLEKMPIPRRDAVEPRTLQMQPLR